MPKSILRCIEQYIAHEHVLPDSKPRGEEEVGGRGVRESLLAVEAPLPTTLGANLILWIDTDHIQGLPPPRRHSCNLPGRLDEPWRVNIDGRSWVGYKAGGKSRGIDTTVEYTAQKVLCSQK